MIHDYTDADIATAKSWIINLTADSIAQLEAEIAQLTAERALTIDDDDESEVEDDDDDDADDDESVNGRYLTPDEMSDHQQILAGRGWKFWQRTMPVYGVPVDGR